MDLSASLETGHEKVATFHDRRTDLRCFVAIYDTRLGPAVGGTRMYDYDSGSEGLEDALRLSRAMAYKTAAAGFEFGGGKAVIDGDPETDKTDELLERYGRAVDSMGGTFSTGEDVGITLADVEVIGETTDYVGGSETGDELTAHGVRQGIEAALCHQRGDDSLAGVEILVQGCGKVGGALVEQLVEAGAAVTIADVDEATVAEYVDRYDVTSVDPDAVFEHPCDVFAPCALGGVVDDETLPKLRCDVIAGSANNQLAERRHASALRDRGILYAPDYVINAGGLIAGLTDSAGGSTAEARTAVGEIGDRLARLFETADEEGITPLAAADRLAEERMAEGGDSLVFGGR